MNFLIKTVLVVEVLCSLIVDGGVPNKKVEVESVLERYGSLKKSCDITHN